jgi:hypothetical protein
VESSQTTLKLPNFQGSTSRVYPFEPKDGTKKGGDWNINLQYTINAENTINSNDEFFGPGFLDQACAGVQHRILSQQTSK